MHAKNVILDGVSFADLPNGARATVTELEGWWDSPEPRVDEDGEPFYQVRPHQARIIDLSVLIHAVSHDQLHLTGEFLVGLLRTRGDLIVSGHGPTTRAEVSRVSRARFTTLGPTAARFSVTLRARDPLRYGAWNDPVTLGSPGTDRVFHRGNTDASPVVHVTGSNLRGGYAIVHGNGSRFEVLTPLYSSGEHIVDFATGRAYSDGTIVPSYGRANMIRIHPGPSQFVGIYPMTEGSVSGVLEVQDTWL